MGAVAGEELVNWEKMEGATSCEEKILVLVRLRPLNETEIAMNEAADWECINNTTMLYRNTLREGSALPNTYTFDRVFRGDCSTRQVFEEGVQEIALSVVSGINSSIFAYGQTSSGKTYTMNGITEYTAADIFDYINKHGERAFVLKFSAIEIYNEAVRDLLSTDAATPLRLLDDSERGVIIEKVREETLRDWSHLKELLSVCEAQRRIGETSLNEKSSRSHQIVRLTIESTAREFVGKDNSTTLTATVNFVDLAGSERASQALSAGARLKEGCHINRSLLTLGTVIRKLSKGRHGHINYRDSKLTRILQPCLGGNARTAIICTMSPARSHVEQSRNTLLFACCAKEVSTKAQVNIVMSDKTLVKHLQKELARLENELKSPITVSSSGDYEALLRKKDLKIQKMKKQIQELTEQRDFAQSRVEDLLRIVGKDEYPPTQGRERNKYEGKGETAWDDEYSASESSNVAEPHSLDISINRSTDPRNYDGCSENDSEENYRQLQENQQNNFLDRENFLPPSYRKKFVKSDSCQSREVTPRAIVGDSDDCREVRGESGGEICTQSIGNEKEIVSMSSGKVNITSQIPAASGHYEWNQVENSISNDAMRSVKLMKSWSCRESMSTCSSFSEKPENTPPYLFDRLEASERKLHPLKLGVRFSRFDSRSSENTTPSIKTLTDVDITRLDTFVSEMNERAKLEYKKQKDAGQVQETDLETGENVESAATQQALEATLDWAKKFESQQRMILQLWQACAISLVHRTYFFLLFRGDSTDSIYMEVELRRLTFLQDRCSRGSEAVEDGQALTLASSTSALHRERSMLSRLMQKRFSEEERNGIFQKWGIALSSKRRRLQLANKLWTNTKDMNHIMESAAIVAKLVKFAEQGQALKGMFELSFTSSRTKRSYSWKKSVVSLI